MDRSFFDIFSTLEDPRNDKGKKYPLMAVLILAIYGTLIGFEDFTNMSYYLKKREAELAKELKLTAGVPSHDVFSDVFRAIDIEAFMRLFVDWTKTLVAFKTGKHIAIDGKAVRAAAKKSKGRRAPYIISAFMAGCGISIGQKMVGNKSCEINEIPSLLNLINIKDCFVTIDAIGTQTTIMQKIMDKGGHFCLQLKSNHPAPFEAVQLYFSDLENNQKQDFYQLECFRSIISKDHGRIEEREYRVLTDLNVIQSILGDKWIFVKCIGMARLTRVIGGAESKETHYHLLDEIVTAEKYANLARGHWAIENNLHWILDIHFHEDQSTANSDHAIENLALLRKIAFNFSKLDPRVNIKSIKKRMIDYMTDIELFKRIIFEAIPNASAGVLIR